MSFFTDASFVMDPNVYGVGKLYVPKPTDGSGDLTFSRASTGTRVNQDGLIEKVRTNLLTYSNDFSNATWQKGGTTIATATSGQTDKDGGTDAWLISWGATQGSSYVYQSISSPSTPNTASCWVKGTAGQKLRFGYGVNVGQGAEITFSGEWQRISHTSSSGTILLFSNFITEFASSFYVQYCQSEASDIATDYIPTTTSAVSVGPLANIPRLNYGSDGCPSLLLEPQRTNLATYSEQFNNAVWVKSNITVTANAAISPDGYTNADLLNITSVSNYIDQNGTIVSGSTYTVSCYVKSAVSSSQTFRLYGNANKSSSAFTATQEWQRFTHTFTADSATMSTGIGSSALVQLYAYGFQLELGAYATSYIPTLSTSVTRIADAASKTGMSSVIGQTKGTIFLDFVWNGKSNTTADNFNFTLGTWATNLISIGNYNSALYARIYESSILNFNVDYGVMTIGTRYKCALAYASNDAVFYVNGSLIGSDSSVNVPALSDVSFNRGTFEGSKEINQALLFKTRLSNADLARLTSL